MLPMHTMSQDSGPSQGGMPMSINGLGIKL
jgi:hypothetical protein